jgi:hypothetical protein
LLYATSEQIKLAQYNHASRDIDRFNSFFEVAKKNNRKMVITPKTAYLFTKLLNDKHLAVPDPLKDDSIRVYYKKKKPGTYNEKDYFPWNANSWTRWLQMNMSARIRAK